MKTMMTTTIMMITLKMIWMMTTATFWGVDWVEELHEVLVVWVGLSAGVHVVAVIVESRRTGVNLPRAMVTGSKVMPDDAFDG